MSGPLRSWLLAEPSDEQAVRTIRGSEILSGEVRMALPALRQAALRPATLDQIEMILKPRFETLGGKLDRTEDQWVAFWADYADALEGLTASAIEAGMRAYLKLPDSEFIPKPGRLRELALNTPNDNRWARAYRIAREAVTVEEPKVIPPEDRDAVKAGFNELMATLSAKVAAREAAMASRRPKARPTCAKVDDTGISPEMRARLEAEGRIAPLPPHEAPPC